MNKRPFLLGLGIGIMVGAALLQLMLVGERQSQKLEQPAPQEKVARTYTQEELDTRIAEERDRIRAELGRETGGKRPAAGSSAPAKQTGSGASAGQGRAESKDPKSAKPKRVIVRIPPNSSLYEAAGLLEANHILGDKQSFIDLMSSTNDKVRAGYFAFEGTPTIEQVRQIVTGSPLDPAAAKAEISQAAGNE